MFEYANMDDALRPVQKCHVLFLCVCFHACIYACIYLWIRIPTILVCSGPRQGVPRWLCRPPGGEDAPWSNIARRAWKSMAAKVSVIAVLPRGVCVPVCMCVYVCVCVALIYTLNYALYILYITYMTCKVVLYIVYLTDMTSLKKYGGQILGYFYPLHTNIHTCMCIYVCMYVCI